MSTCEQEHRVREICSKNGGHLRGLSVDQRLTGLKIVSLSRCTAFCLFSCSGKCSSVPEVMQNSTLYTLCLLCVYYFLPLTKEPGGVIWLHWGEWNIAADKFLQNRAKRDSSDTRGSVCDTLEYFSVLVFFLYTVWKSLHSMLFRYSVLQ